MSCISVNLYQNVTLIKYAIKVSYPTNCTQLKKDYNNNNLQMIFMMMEVGGHVDTLYQNMTWAWTSDTCLEKMRWGKRIYLNFENSKSRNFGPLVVVARRRASMCPVPKWPNDNGRMTNQVITLINKPIAKFERFFGTLRVPR